jgi:hypothetical protein
MSKKFLPWDDFSLPSQAVDLVKESVRSGIEFDAYGNRQNFTALALTNAYLLDDVEAAGYGAAADGLNLGRGSKYKFKARIIDEDSPHLFLPDPCSLAENDNQDVTAAAIQRHTDFIQINATNINRVSMGDIVQVTLRKNVFSYDLQVGVFNKVLAHNAKAADLLGSIDCLTLVAQFTDLPPGPLKTVSLDDLTNVSYTAGAKFTEPQKKWIALFMRKLALEYQPDTVTPWVTKVHFTSGYRDFLATAKIFWTYLSDSSKGETYLRKMYGNYARINDIIATQPQVTKENLNVWVRIIAAAYDASPPVIASRHQLGEAIDIRTSSPLYTTDQLQALARAASAAGAKKWYFEPFGATRTTAPFKNNTDSILVERVTAGTPVPHEHMNIAIKTTGIT